MYNDVIDTCQRTYLLLRVRALAVSSYFHFVLWPLDSFVDGEKSLVFAISMQSYDPWIPI